MFWALASAGYLSESLLATLSLRSSSSGPMSKQTELQLAAAYLAVPVIAKHIPQNVLVQCVQARKSHWAEANNTKARNPAQDLRRGSALVHFQICPDSDILLPSKRSKGKHDHPLPDVFRLLIIAS